MDLRTQKRLDEIGTRFIRGTVDQLAGLQSLAARIHEGDPAGLAELESLTHQLYGSAAMFRFEAVSAKAGKINALLKSVEADPATWNLPLLDSLLTDLSDAVHDAAASRRRRSSDNRLEWPDQSRDAQGT
ncbi:MAG: Hpt domain-containing protein [Steroidobacteraceae bacterium]